MSEVKKQKIKLHIGGGTYSLDIAADKEEIYRLAEQEVNTRVGIYERNYAGVYKLQDCLAITALAMAINYMDLARSREVGSEDVKELKRLGDRIDSYLNRIDHGQ